MYRNDLHFSLHFCMAYWGVKMILNFREQLTILFFMHVLLTLPFHDSEGVYINKYIQDI